MDGAHHRFGVGPVSPRLDGKKRFASGRRLVGFANELTKIACAISLYLLQR